MAESNLGWRRGSVLNRLTDEKADASAALMQAARDAREIFGDDAGVQLAETLRIVGETAGELGIDVGGKVRALLDAHAATFAGGTISLHNEDGVPLRGLGYRVYPASHCRASAKSGGAIVNPSGG